MAPQIGSVRQRGDRAHPHVARDGHVLLVVEVQELELGERERRRQVGARHEAMRERLDAVGALVAARLDDLERGRGIGITGHHEGDESRTEEAVSHMRAMEAAQCVSS